MPNANPIVGQVIGSGGTGGFDPNAFAQGVADQHTVNQTVGEKFNWLRGQDLQGAIDNWDKIDSHTQSVLLNNWDVAGGTGGALKELIQAKQNGVDPTLISQAISGMKSGQNQDKIIQNLQQQNAQQGQLNSQNQQLSAFNKSYQGQMFGTDASGNPLSMTDALSGNTGTIGQLNQFETGQTADTFNKLLSPEITMALGGQGLNNSGAQVELQSKALAGLQLAQQQNIMQAALGAQSQGQQLQQNQVLGNIAGQQGMVANTLNTNNSYMTMQFQQQLMQQQSDLARQLSSYGGGSGGGGIGSAIGGGLGSIVGGIYGGPSGAAAGGALGSSLGGSIGGAVSPGSSGSGPNTSGFYAASQSLPKTWRSSIGGQTAPSVSGYGNGGSLSLGGTSAYS